MTAYTITLCRADSSEISIKNKVMHYGETNWADQLSTYYPETYEFSRLYDPVGNPLFDENYEYTWENGRELASIKSKATNAIIASYEYDSSGLRISKTTPTETVYYAYDENANLIFEKHDGYTLAFHYDGNGIRTHFDHITSSATNTYYYRYNLQGDVIALLNSAGTVVANYEYTPYGKEVYTPNAIGSLNPFRYKGYYFDTETSFYYLQSRYYDPEICRFINADDPDYLGATGTLLSYNLYTYCENDPVNNFDPTGNWVVSITFSNGFAVLGGINSFFSLLFDSSGEIGVYHGKTVLIGFAGGKSLSVGIHWAYKRVKDYVNAASFSWNIAFGVGMGLASDYPDEHSSKTRLVGFQLSIGTKSFSLYRESCAIDGGKYYSLTKYFSSVVKSAKKIFSKLLTY